MSVVRASVPVGALAAAVIAVTAIGTVLALYTDSDAVGTNSFSTAPCFSGSDTGFLDPSAQSADTGGDGDGFESNPTSAFSDGGGDASNVDGDADRHRYYDYGVAIDASCTIAGIEVRLDWYVDSVSDTSTLDVELSWDGGTSWTSAKTATSQATSEQTELVGGSADTWGHSWTPSELSDASFRARVTSNCSGAGCASRDYFLDWIPLKVYYSP